MQICFILLLTNNNSALTFHFTLFVWNLRWVDSPPRCCRSLTYLATQMLHVTSLKDELPHETLCRRHKIPPAPPHTCQTLFM